MNSFAERMLDYLMEVANGNLDVNLWIHIAVLGVLISVYVIKNTEIRSTLMKATVFLLLTSVAVHAFVYGNPVHFGTFAVVAASAAFQLVKRKSIIEWSKNPRNTMFSVTIMFLGFWYPKFVEVNALESLLYSPLGVVPCATLLMTLGLLTACYPSVSKVQYGITTLAALFYGTVGVFVFKVYFDISLLILVIYAAVNLLASVTKQRAALGGRIVEKARG
ncbi:hypothetical protein FZC66_16530 [Priestia megaterium]|nr:hypothetical protein FZC66_16530 [Priestia megaterium]